MQTSDAVLILILQKTSTPSIGLIHRPRLPPPSHHPSNAYSSAKPRSLRAHAQSGHLHTNRNKGRDLDDIGRRSLEADQNFEGAQGRKPSKQPAACATGRSNSSALQARRTPPGTSRTDGKHACRNQYSRPSHTAPPGIGAQRSQHLVPRHMYYRNTLA